MSTNQLRSFRAFAFRFCLAEVSGQDDDILHDCIGFSGFERDIMQVKKCYSDFVELVIARRCISHHPPSHLQGNSKVNPARAIA
ncbi:hypothetical protein B7W85_19675 [Allorhizobium ampelinum]|nr:hypothetical protein B7W85_19675 [Allorhizobium ampelinum]